MLEQCAINVRCLWVACYCHNFYIFILCLLCIYHSAYHIMTNDNNYCIYATPNKRDSSFYLFFRSNATCFANVLVSNMTVLKYPLVNTECMGLRADLPIINYNNS